jgi:hypothetical protein
VINSMRHFHDHCSFDHEKRLLPPFITDAYSKPIRSTPISDQAEEVQRVRSTLPLLCASSRNLQQAHRSVSRFSEFF